MANNVKEGDYGLGKPESKRKATASAILIGMGLAGLIDIIVFHAILQWHHTSSLIIIPNTLESLQTNLLHDGAFLSLSLIITIAGIILLWNASSSNSKHSLLSNKRSFLGLVFIGLGGFNIVEGIINHHILQMHHVIDVAEPLAFDLAFLVVGGLAFVVVGGILLKSQKA